MADSNGDSEMNGSAATSTSERISIAEYERQAIEYTTEMVEKLNLEVRATPAIAQRSRYFRDRDNIERGLPVFQGKHTRFVYDDDDDDIVEYVDATDAPLPAPHIRTADELEDAEESEEYDEDNDADEEDEEDEEDEDDDDESEEEEESDEAMSSPSNSHDAEEGEDEEALAADAGALDTIASELAEMQLAAQQFMMSSGAMDDAARR